MQEYGNLMNTFSDYLIYDERKGRMLHTRYLNKAQFYEMWRFHFNRLRPDLSESDNNEFILVQRLARNLLGYLRNENLMELKRELYVNPLYYPENVNDALINHLNYLAPSPAGTIEARTTSWIDATKSLAYIKSVTSKIEEYGLHYPLLSARQTSEQAAELEDRLYKHFKSLLTKS